MRFYRILFIQVFFVIIFINQSVIASGTMTNAQVFNVKRTAINSDKLRRQLQKSAVLLANYEIETKKLIRMTENGTDSQTIGRQASQLLELSRVVIDSARFRLPQCDAYLRQALTLRDQLADISYARLEKDYHHDGILPRAPAECYNAKDLFVHPATVLVLTRDDPALSDTTLNSIKAEMTEVLAHTEVVRQLVLY